MRARRSAIDRPASMTIFWTIFKRECLGHLLELRSQVVLLLLLILSALAITLGASDLRVRQEAVLQAQREIERQRAKELSFQDLQGQPFVFQRPPALLSMFAHGADSELTRPVRLQVSMWRGRPLSVGPPAQTNPVGRLFSRPDLVYVIAVVLSFAALFITHDAIAGEREQGTLRLIFAGAVPRDLVLLAKWWGSFATLALPLVLALGLGLAAATSLYGFSLDREALLRLGAIALGALVYLALFVSLGLFISAAVRQAATALVLCLLAWMILVPVGPSLATMMAHYLRPLTASGQREFEKDQIARQSRKRMERDMAKAEGAGGGGGGMEMGLGYFLRLREGVKKETTRVERAGRNLMAAQTGLAKDWARASPAACFAFLATELAGTGPAHYLRHINEVDVLNDRFTGAIEKMAIDGFEQKGWEFFRENVDVSHLPVFAPTGLPQGRLFETVLWDAAILVIWALLLFLAAYLRFLRYDPR